MLEDKRYLFWALQLAGWGSWALTFYFGMLVWERPSNLYIIYLPIISTIGILITLVLRALYRAVWNRDILVRAMAILVGCYIGGALWMSSRVLIFEHLFLKPSRAGKDFWAHFDGTSRAFMIMIVWSVLYFGIKFYMMAQEEMQRRLKASAMAHEAQLKMLHYQLNPHFLFNTLNAISTLILDKNTTLANSMVTRLSRFLRYSLDNDPMLKVTVADEVEALKLYLDIEKVRFDERLRLIFDIDPASKSALMPSLLLQPLVENSIKYAISQSINGGTIAVTAAVSGGDLLLSVADDGPGLDLRNGRLPKGGGVGLANCRERLKEIYAEQQSFRLSTTDPHGLTVTIRIPMEEELPTT